MEHNGEDYKIISEDDDLYLLNITEVTEKIDSIKKLYEKYKEKKNELDDLNEKIRNFKNDGNNSYILFQLASIKKMASEKNIDFRELKITDIIFENNPSLKEYCDNLDRIRKVKKSINELFEYVYDNSYSELYLLNRNGKKYILELLEKEIVDVTDYEPDLIDFIKMILNSKMPEITDEDLPVLMAIKEEINYEPDYLKEIDSYTRDEEEYYYKSAIPYDIKLELIRAKMTDAKIEKQDDIVNTLPFITDSDEQIKLMDNLVKNEKILRQEDYWKEYYKIQMLFGSNIEELYLEAPADKKAYVIDAYYECSVLIEKKFRTASPIVNIELLKRKYMNKNR